VKPWSEEEDRRLRQLSHLPLRDIARSLGRTENSIRARGRRLGLEFHCVKHKPHWSSDEIEVLRRYYTSETSQELRDLFPHRTSIAIKRKADRDQIFADSINKWLKEKTLPSLKHDDVVYIAGFLDGEGMITIAVHDNRARSDHSVSLLPLISIANTDREQMEWLHGLLQGSILLTSTGRRGCKTAYILQLSQLRNVKSLLEQLLPYLRVKKRQAQLVLEFCNIRLQEQLGKRCDRAFEIAKEVRDLNKRGK